MLGNLPTSSNGTIFVINLPALHSMRTVTIFIFSLLLLSFQLQGQEIRVLSSQDKRPVEHVAVFTRDRDRAAISDENGKIDLAIFIGADSVFFQHPSYSTVLMSLEDLKHEGKVLLSRRKIAIDEFVISASKTREQKIHIPHMVDVLEEEELEESTGLTSAEILEGTGNIMVQKTQGGGGSPILRGFEANKILLVVDGVRMNNAIYRNGHLQNSITIDHSILERAEIIFGPSSIIYGSDALGGVIHYYTRDPKVTGDSTAYFKGGASVQYASAMRGKSVHADIEMGSKRWAGLSSVSYKALEDVRMGGQRHPSLGDWGLIRHYVEQVNGVDSMMTNENPQIQKNTAYSQLDLLQKIRYSPSRYVDWFLNLQYSTSSDIDRLDKLNDYNEDYLKYAAYYYGPQNRFLASLKNVLKHNNPLFTNMTTLVAWQRIDEDRFTRKFKNDERLSQEEDVQVLSLNVDLLRIWKSKHRLNYGAELAFNHVASSARYTHISTGESTEALTRYPDGGSTTQSYSIYASYKQNINEKLILNLGTRYNLGSMASFFSNPILPYDEINIRHGALTGSAALVYLPTDRWRLNAILSTGFRNPNVDDYGKVRAKDDYVTVPNPDLVPEYTYNAEIGVTRFIEEYMKIQVIAYYTHLNHAIVRSSFKLGEQDSLLYDGDMYLITSMTNAASARIFGASLAIEGKLNRHISLKSSLNYTSGTNLSEDVPLGHIPPLFGRSSISYRKDRFYFDTYFVYQGWKDIEDFSPYGEDNDSEAMEHGYPSWWTLNIKTGYRSSAGFDLTFAIENILDQFYKPFASGISAPGRNFIITARFSI